MTTKALSQLKILVASLLLVTIVVLCPRLAFGATSDWIGYGDSGNGSSYVTRNTPTATCNLNWTFDYNAITGSTFASCSEPVLYNDNVVIAVNKNLYQINKTTGKVASQMELLSTIGYTTRTFVSGTKLIVPLNEGITQCIDLDTMQSLWVTSKITNLTQTTATIRSQGSYVYISTCDVNFSTSTYNNGHLQKINVESGEIVWEYISSNEGYYWTGPAIVGQYILSLTSQGTVDVISCESGSKISSISLGSNALSDCIYNSSKGEIYVVTENGALNILSLSSSGQVTLLSTSNIGLKATQNTGLSRVVSTPVLADNYLIIGGQTENASALSIVNLNDYSSSVITTANGQSLPLGGVRGSSLVSKVEQDIYVYFTVNNAVTQDYINYTSGGGIYMYKLGDTDSSILYDATNFNQYCDSPVIADLSGNLYYINDSGNLFGLSSVTTPVPTPFPVPTPEQNSSVAEQVTPSGNEAIETLNLDTAQAEYSAIDTPTTTSSELAETSDAFAGYIVVFYLAFFVSLLSVIVYCNSKSK